MKADLSLLLITAIWGMSFVIIKNAVAAIDPYTFIALRFVLAFAMLALVFWRRLLRLDRPTLRAGVIAGVFLLAGFAFQTFGLQLVSASKGGFITGLSVVMVPFLAWRILSQTPSRNAVAGVVLATVGLLLLSLKDDWTMEYGDLLVLACALAFALHIVFIGKYAPRHDAMKLATVQIGFVAVTSSVLTIVFEGVPMALPSDGLAAAVFTGLVATALAYAIQNKAQVFTTPTHTALIFTMEPLFAALFAVVWAGELLTERVIVGGVLILAGMVVAEVPLERLARRQTTLPEL